MTNIITQQTRARKEFNALGRAEKNEITPRELANEMAKMSDDPDSAISLLQATASLPYMAGVKNGETPITDATNALLREKKSFKNPVTQG